jgi:uncharacterized protein (DUF983 family)
LGESPAPDVPIRWGKLDDGSMTPRRPSIPRALARGVAGRCPHCGGRGVLVGWARLADRCPTCGLWLHRSNGMSMGSLGINTVATFATLFAVQVTGLVLTWPDFPVTTLIAIALSWAVVFPIAFHRSAQTLWLAMDVLLRPIEDDELGEARPPQRA